VRTVQLDAEPADGRPRRWHAWIRPTSGDVELTHAVVLEPGEEVDDQPPRKTISLQEWARTHADYGLDAAGRPLEAS
jgi:hypothetical protein